MIEASQIPLIARYEQSLTTEVSPVKTFFNAEDYHQKYALQRHDAIMTQFKLTYPKFNDFVNSTAAARLNGFAYGCGAKEVFEEEQGRFGISKDLLLTL